MPPVIMRRKPVILSPTPGHHASPAAPGSQVELDLVDRLVRLPQYHPDALQLDPGIAVRRRPDAAGLSFKHLGGLDPRKHRGPLDGPRLCAVLLGFIGLVRVATWQWDGLTLIALGLFVELLVRTEARMLEDGGYFEDGVFGYDFSEGYTSLESGTPKVRPYRESALKRWRRRRSELRRQRRTIREAAEEKRMDEILEKLHREGRTRL